MMYATKIKMRQGCHHSQNLLKIDEIFIEGCSNSGFFKKAAIHDYLKKNPGTIKVAITPYPTVIPAVSVNREKYVRSNPNGNARDNLLELLRV